jgi:hypothetical protein
MFVSNCEVASEVDLKHTKEPAGSNLVENLNSCEIFKYFSTTMESRWIPVVNMFASVLHRELDEHALYRVLGTKHSANNRHLTLPTFAECWGPDTRH